MNILVAIDGSRAGFHALEVAAHLRKQGKLIILHVADTEGNPRGGLEREMFASDIDLRASRLGIPTRKYETIVVSKEGRERTRHVIHRIATEVNADVVVLGKFGTKGLSVFGLDGDTDYSVRDLPAAICIAKSVSWVPRRAGPAGGSSQEEKGAGAKRAAPAAAAAAAAKTTAAESKSTAGHKRATAKKGDSDDESGRKVDEGRRASWYDDGDGGRATWCVTVDSSTAARAGFDLALALMHEGDRLRVCHIVRETMGDPENDESETILEEYEALAAELSVDVEVRIRDKAARRTLSQEIMDWADEERATHLICGTDGMKAYRRGERSIGSVSDYLAKHFRGTVILTKDGPSAR